MNLQSCISVNKGNMGMTNLPVRSGGGGGGDPSNRWDDLKMGGLIPLYGLSLCKIYKW